MGVRPARLWWSIRDLESGRVVPALPEVEDAARCKRHFSPERWSEFRRDASYFWNRVGIPVWAQITTDHGFNATPVWMAAATPLASLAPASDGFLSLLAALDGLLLVTAAAAFGWAFGGRALAWAVFFFAVNAPSEFGWVGGAYLRHDWLALLVLSLCLLRRGHPGWAGACLAYSSLLRLFPVLLFAGAAVGAAIELRRSGRVSRETRSFLLGAGAAATVLVAAGAGVAGAKSFPAFAEHIRRFESTPLTNHVGLRAALSFRADAREEELRRRGVEELWPTWAELRARAYRPMLPVHLAILGLFAVPFVRATRRATLWQSTALGLAWIPLVPQLTCYYYSFPAASAALAGARGGGGVAPLLLGAALGGQLAVAGFDQWDEQYAAVSVVFVLWALLLPLAWRRDEAVATSSGDAAAVEPGSAASAGSGIGPATAC